MQPHLEELRFRLHAAKIKSLNKCRKCRYISIMLSEITGNEGIVMQWCNPLTLRPEQFGGAGSIPDMAQGAPIGPHHLSVMAKGRGFG